jgi:hypothetical protein
MAVSWAMWLRSRRRGATGGVVVGAKIVEVGSRVGQQVPEDDQDGAGDRDQGLEFAAAFDQAPVALAEEGVGLGQAAAAA